MSFYDAFNKGGLQNLCKEKGIEVADEDTKATLKEKLDAYFDAHPDELPADPRPTVTAAEFIFYWLKVPSVIKDDKEGLVVWPGGLYRVSEPVARLEKSDRAYVEKFTGTIPEPALHEIAKRYGISVEYFVGNERKFKSPAEILAAIVQEPPSPSK